MPEPDQLTQLQEMLASDIHSKRRAGVAFGAEMLANGLHRTEVRALLEQVVQNDLLTTIQADARQALAADDARHSPPKSPDYVFGAKCPQGHVSYYDKRETCPKSSNVTRRTVWRDERNVDELLLRCKTPGCKQEFYVEVNCEGYK